MMRAPSIKRNIVANYASSAFIAALSIVVVPLYIRYLGLEVYGLVGVFMMLQSLFSLLDFGLSATMMREAARSRAGASSPSDLRQVLVTLEVVFCLIAIIAGIGMVATSGWIGSDWLKTESLDHDTVQLAIILMAPTVAFRFISALYRSLITGFEDLVWLGGFNAVIGAARFALVVPMFEIFGASSDLFFVVQLAVAAIELTVLFIRAHRSIGAAGRPPVSFRALRSIMGFSLAAALSGITWVAVTQSDKLVLSAVLPLSQYAVFSVVALIANGLLLVSAPISGALVPRLMKLHAAGEEGTLVSLYRRGTQLNALIVLPIAITIALFARELLWVWTGDAAVTNGGAGALSLYVTGTAILTLNGFVAYLQYARGNIRLHVIGSLLFLSIQVPLVLWLARQYGAFGAGCAWLLVNTLFFVGWVPLMHRRFLPGIHLRWLTKDIGMILLPALTVGALFHQFVTFPASRIVSGMLLAMIGSTVLLIAGCASPWIRDMASTNFRKFRKRSAVGTMSTTE
jgi:O-antigen/teichoic acid export membrane protein